MDNEIISLRPKSIMIYFMLKYRHNVNLDLLCDKVSCFYIENYVFACYSKDVFFLMQQRDCFKLATANW